MQKFDHIPAQRRMTIACGALAIMAVCGASNVYAQSINLAAHKPSTASSFEGSSLVSSGAVDENPSTRWASLRTDSEWIQVDLGSPQTFNTVTLNWEAAYARAYSVQVSADGRSWKTVFSTSSGNGGTEKIDFQSTVARYVRMQGVARATYYGYSLYEFKVSNENSGASPSPTPTVNGLPTDAIFAPSSFWY